MGRSGESDQEHTAGLVLCGGASRRMGRDKALLPYGPGNLLQHALRRLDPLCTEVALATGSTPRYADQERPLVLDGAPEQGPLAGLVAGLEWCPRDWLLVLAVDVPRVTTAQLDDLLERARGAAADVAVYRSPDGPPPLVGAYHRRALPAFRAALDAGRRRMVDGWGELRADGSRLCVLEVEAPVEALENWNHPLDVTALEERA